MVFPIQNRTCHSGNLLFYKDQTCTVHYWEDYSSGVIQQNATQRAVVADRFRGGSALARPLDPLRPSVPCPGYKTRNLLIFFAPIQIDNRRFDARTQPSGDGGGGAVFGSDERQPQRGPPYSTPSRTTAPHAAAVYAGFVAANRRKTAP